MRLDLKVHEQRVARDGSVKEVRTNPYIRVCVADFPPVYVQDGRFFAEEVGLLDGDDLPEWVIPELAKCSPEALAEVKLSASVMQDVQKARTAYQAQQKAAAAERRKKLYGDGKSH